MSHSEHVTPKVQTLHHALVSMHEKLAHRTAGFYQDMEGYFHVNHGRNLGEIKAQCVELEKQALVLSERLLHLIGECRDDATLIERALHFIDADMGKMNRAIGLLTPYLPKLNFNDSSLAQRSSRELVSFFTAITDTRAFLEAKKHESTPAPEAKAKIEILPPDPNNLYHRGERRQLELTRDELQKQVGKDLDAIDLILYIQEKLRRDMSSDDSGLLRKLVASVGQRLGTLLFKKEVTQEQLVQHGVLSKDLPKLPIRHFRDKRHYSLGAILIYVSDFAAILADMRERAYGKNPRDSLQFEELKESVMGQLVSLALLTEDPGIVPGDSAGPDTVYIIKRLYAVFNEMSTLFNRSSYAQATEIRTSFSFLSKSLADFKAELTTP